MFKSSQNAEAALQNNTRPGETGTPEDETVAVRVTTAPSAAELPGETVNSVVVGEGVAATASAAFRKPAASTRPKETDKAQLRLLKGGPLEAA
jgi:hypothetical protein